jgi:hypothetical protein
MLWVTMKNTEKTYASDDLGVFGAVARVCTFSVFSVRTKKKTRKQNLLAGL